HRAVARLLDRWRVGGSQNRVYTASRDLSAGSYQEVDRERNIVRHRGTVKPRDAHSNRRGLEAPVRGPRSKAQNERLIFMCGICGFARRRGSPNWSREGEPAAVDQAALIRMRDSLTHRGPDDAGSFFDSSVALGHRRLSIVDLGGGHQPMTNEDGSI